MITSFFKPVAESPAKNESTNQTKTENKRGNKNLDSPRSTPKKLKPSAPEPTPSRNSNPSEADELLKHLNCESGAKSWRAALTPHSSKSTFRTLAKFVSAERSSRVVYPPAQDTFASLNLTPLASVKIVVVGQDPYHGPGQGHGLSFSVRKGVAIPPSLRNIYKELREDEGVSFEVPTHGCLERWARQGVLLLNAVLTVRKGEANSHAKRGWEEFTDAVIRVLNQERSGLVFLLWGNPASKKAQRHIDGRKHTVICTSHPSPLGAYKTKSPFLGSRCFGRANEALRSRGMEEIDWNVDDKLNVVHL